MNMTRKLLILAAMVASLGLVTGCSKGDDAPAPGGGGGTPPAGAAGGAGGAGGGM